jgi:hypothetical protein
LPPAPSSLVQADNCRDVRSGRLAWDVSRPLSLDASESRRQAINEALSEFVKEFSGTEVRSLARTADSLTKESYTSEFQAAEYAKAMGRVIDDRILDISSHQVAGSWQIHVEIDGRVCVDDLVKPPLIVAIRDSGSLSPAGVAALQGSLSKSFAHDPRLALADRAAANAYHDIDVEASVDGPQSWSIDRSAAISAIRLHVGSAAASGIAQQGTRVSLRVTLRATEQASGLAFVETQTAERELTGSDQASGPVVAELEQEAARAAGQALAQTLTQHVKRHEAENHARF